MQQQKRKSQQTQEVITISEAAQILGFKKTNEAKAWLKWNRIPLMDIGNNTFLKWEQLQSGILRIMEKTATENGSSQNSDRTSLYGNQIQAYIPQGMEKEFYNRLMDHLQKGSKHI